MISGVYMKNFKSFLDTYVDLHQNKTQAKSLIAIYGENGAGKTNIIDALRILSQSMDTVMLTKTITKLTQNDDNGSKGNLTSLNRFAGVINATNFKDLVSETHTIESNDKTLLHYDFIINQVEGYYEIEYSPEGELVYEELFYLGNKRRVVMFSTESAEEVQLSHLAFPNAGVRKELEEASKKLWGKHTFLAILNDYLHEINQKYASQAFSKHLIEIFYEFNNFAYLTDNVRGYIPHDHLLQNIRNGVVSTSKVNLIHETEKAVNSYLTSLYSDVQSVSYELTQEGNRVKYELMIHKQIGNEVRQIPVHLESKGTRKVLDLFPLFITVLKGKTLIIDEIDSGIHDVLISNIIKNIADAMTGQLIFTTYDTLLMQNMDKSSVYVIDSDAEGNKDVYPISEYSATNNNPTRQYLKGEFSGIPYPEDIDFTDLMSNFSESGKQDV